MIKYDESILRSIKICMDAEVSNHTEIVDNKIVVYLADGSKALIEIK